MLPPIGAFLFKLMHFLWLYAARVPCTFKQRLGAALAGTALTHAIATAILRGIFTKSMPFLRTPKCESKSAVVKGLMMARGEALMMGAAFLCGGGQLQLRQRPDRGEADPVGPASDPIAAICRGPAAVAFQRSARRPAAALGG